VLAVLIVGSELLPPELRLCNHQRFVPDLVSQIELGQVALSAVRYADRRHDLPGNPRAIGRACELPRTG
jgi:hypothetical protein